MPGLHQVRSAAGLRPSPLHRSLFARSAKNAAAVEGDLAALLEPLVGDAEEAAPEQWALLLVEALLPPSPPERTRLAACLLKACEPALLPRVVSLCEAAMERIVGGDGGGGGGGGRGGHKGQPLRRHLPKALAQLAVACPGLPNMMAGAFARHLGEEDEHARAAAARILADFFIEEPSSAAEYAPLFNLFVGRFVDVAPAVRAALCAWAGSWLPAFAPPSQAAGAAPLSTVIESLARACSDTEEKVRLAASGAALAAVRHAVAPPPLAALPGATPPHARASKQLLAAALRCVEDKKPGVRKACVAPAAAAYAAAQAARARLLLLQQQQQQQQKSSSAPLPESDSSAQPFAAPPPPQPAPPPPLPSAPPGAHKLMVALDEVPGRLLPNVARDDPDSTDALVDALWPHTLPPSAAAAALVAAAGFSEAGARCVEAAVRRRGAAAAAASAWLAARLAAKPGGAGSQLPASQLAAAVDDADEEEEDGSDESGSSGGEEGGSPRAGRAGARRKRQPAAAAAKAKAKAGGAAALPAPAAPPSAVALEAAATWLASILHPRKPEAAVKELHDLGRAKDGHVFRALASLVSPDACAFTPPPLPPPPAAAAGGAAAAAAPPPLAHPLRTDVVRRLGGEKSRDGAFAHSTLLPKISPGPIDAFVVASLLDLLLASTAAGGGRAIRGAGGGGGGGEATDDDDGDGDDDDDDDGSDLPRDAASALRLLSCAACATPALFRTAGPSLLALLTAPRPPPPLLTGALRVLAACGSAVAADADGSVASKAATARAKPFKQPLTQMLTSGERRQAKLAVAALAAMQPQGADALADALISRRALANSSRFSS